MSERSKNLLIAALTLIMGAVLIVMVATNETPDDRVERIGSSIMCPVCQGESIANSPAPMATDMMALVEERVGEGASDEEIVAELLGSFSGAVLLDPPVSGVTLLLWLAPVAALLAGVAMVLWWKTHPGGPRAETTPGTTTRQLVGGLVLIGGFVAIVLVAGSLLQDSATPNAGVADVEIGDLDDVSSETMEAVVAASQDDPQINGMRLALAERYFDAGDYRAAFPHYLQVAQDERSTAAEATTALIRLGWMAYDGNGEVETAVTLLDEALAISPGSQVALYFKGQVLWCGSGANEQAAELFEEILADDNLDEATRSQVEADLSSVSAGEGCT